MDNIWDGKSKVMAVVAGMKKINAFAEPTQLNANFKLFFL